MACVNPITIRTRGRGVKRNYQVPCGHCLNCLIKKESQIEFLAKKELLYNYLDGKSASFVTLTYDDNHIPRNELGFVSLRRSDLQKFIKNMRRQMEYYHADNPFKYLYCGEYGDGSHSTSKTGVSTCRPHYHIVFIGLGPEQVKKYTRKLWKHGLCDIGPLGQGGIRYLCKYMTKSCPDKDVKEFRNACNVQNPFFYHSIGLGKKWIIDNMQKIVEDNFTFKLTGKKYLFPKYVMQFVSLHTGVDYRRKVTEFIHKEIKPIADVHKIEVNQYMFEESFIKYRYKVASLRSQNKPINDITMNKAYIRPYHSVDRSYINRMVGVASLLQSINS